MCGGEIGELGLMEGFGTGGGDWKRGGEDLMGFEAERWQE